MQLAERLASGFVLCALATAACGDKPGDQFDGKTTEPTKSAPGGGDRASASGVAASAPSSAVSAAKSASAPPEARKAPPKLGVWAKNLGSKSVDGDVPMGYVDPEVGRAVAVDSRGNVIVTGRFRGTADFGGGELTSAGEVDVVVAQYDKGGAHRWSKRFGGPESDTGGAVVVDANDNVYVAGNFDGSIDFGSGAYRASGGAYLLKLDENGGYLSSTPILDGRAGGLALAPDGDVLVCGNAWKKLTIGGESPPSGGGTAYLARLDAIGKIKWIKTFGSKDGDVDAEAVGVHTDGSIYLLTTLEKTASFGGPALTSAGSDDVAIVKLDASGAHVWSRSFGAAAREYAAGLGVDASGAVVFAGSFSAPIDLGGGKLVSNGGEDAFVAKLDASGAHVWSKRYGSRQNDDGRSVAVDAKGNVVLSGEFMGQGDFDGNKLASAGDRDSFIVHLDPNGAMAWAKRFGGPSSEWAGGVAIGGGGGVVATGNFSGKATLDAGSTLTSNGYHDLYVLAISE